MSLIGYPRENGVGLRGSGGLRIRAPPGHRSAPCVASRPRIAPAPGVTIGPGISLVPVIGLAPHVALAPGVALAAVVGSRPRIAVVRLRAAPARARHVHDVVIAVGIFVGGSAEVLCTS